jgi:hypothetical protein
MAQAADLFGIQCVFIFLYCFTYLLFYFTDYLLGVKCVFNVVLFYLPVVLLLQMCLFFFLFNVLIDGFIVL